MRIVIGQTSQTKVITKEKKNYLVVGLPAADKLLCSGLDGARGIFVLHKDQVESVDVKVTKPLFIEQPRYGGVV